jgi:outer membrane protein
MNRRTPLARRLLVCAAALWLGTGAAAADAAAQQEAGPLSLDDALHLARQRNPSFQRTRSDLELASNAVRAAWGAFLPGLSSGLSFSGSHSTALTGQDAYGHPVRLPEARTARGSTASQSVGTQVTVFDGAQSLRHVQAQRAMYSATAAQIAAQEVALVGQVSRDYYHALRAVRNIALEQALLASARERLARTEELLRLAARNRVDMLGARADVAHAEQNVERARGDADKARLALAASLGIEPTTSLMLDSVLPPVFDPAELDVDGLVATALARSPVVRHRTAAADAAAHRATAARGRRLPVITASAGYGRSMTLPNYGAFGELDPQNYGFNFGVSVALPLFTRFQMGAQIAEAVAAAQNAVHDLRGARLAVQRDVRQAAIDLLHAFRSLRLAEQNAELSRERQELTQEQYRLGGITFTELQNVIDRTAQAERQALEARFAFINARLVLEERLGAPLEG